MDPTMTAFGKMSLASPETPQAKHETEKFLALNILQNVYESGAMHEKYYHICKNAIISSSQFEARSLMAYAPPHWKQATEEPNFAPRENFPSASLASCYLLLHNVAAYCRLPWRTVITGTVILQRYCNASANIDKGRKEELFLHSLSYSQRVVLVASCLLLATKVEESLCKISTVLNGLKEVLGQSAFLNAIPSNSQFNTAHVDVDEAMAWPLRIQESGILEVLGFDVEVPHPHYYIRILHSLPYCSHSLSDQQKENILMRAYSLLDKCVLGTATPLPSVSTPLLVALGASYLAWFIHHKDDDTFNWDIINLSSENKRELKATIECLILIANDQEAAKLTNWESLFFQDVEKGEIHHEFKPRVCRSVDHYEKIEAICEGTYGTVWDARERSTNERVALKQLKNTLGRNGFPYYMLREVMFLRRLNHPNVVSGQEVVFKPLKDGTREFYIVMEYISFDMRDLWLAQKDNTAHPPWNEANIKHLVLQLLDAISYMHRRGLMHRDIKLENLLFDSGVLKVADLGSIRDAGRTALKLTTAVVTLWYRPPELLLGNTEYTSAIDIWSIGCVIVELLAMAALFPGRDVDDMMYRIVSCIGKPSPDVWNNYFAKLPMANKIWPLICRIPAGNSLEVVLKGYSPSCVDLLRRMICYDPTARITAEEALEHPYFKEAPLPKEYRPKQ